MRFEVVGPFFIQTPRIIKVDHIKDLEVEIAERSEEDAKLLGGPGCYIFGVKTSSRRVIPWYVGKAEKQSVFKEATNTAHLQIYNEILDEYEKGYPALIFLPQVTAKGKPTSLAKGDGRRQAVDFVEDWLIAAALKSNPNLFNIKKTKMLSELWIRGVFNPTQGDSSKSSQALKAALRL